MAVAAVGPVRYMFPLEKVRLRGMAVPGFGAGGAIARSPSGSRVEREGSSLAGPEGRPPTPPGGAFPGRLAPR